MQQLPESFINNISRLLPEDKQAFFESIHAVPVTSVRLNNRKPSGSFDHNSSQVPWCGSGRYLTGRPLFIADPLFHAGAYYVQESSSMFLEQIMKVVRSETSGPIKVLDLCAAPGGKSTLLLSMLNDDELLVSNEIIRNRVNILEENMIRWGRSNVVVSNNDPAAFGKLSSYFDVIVADAPCSGEGMFRKDKSAIEEWSPANVALCASRQQRIMADVIGALKPGGYLIYSTCTFNTQENEENVKWLMDNFDIETVQIPVDPSWGIQVVNSWNGAELNAFRFYPHKVSGEGFFAACLRKKGTSADKAEKKEGKPDKIKQADSDLLVSWIDEPEKFVLTAAQDGVYALPAVLAREMAHLRKILHVRLAGLKLGEVMKGKLVPDHQLALSVHVRNDVPSLELNRIEALTFLKKETFPVPEVSQGIYRVTHQGLGLGWVKVLANRINNYLPVNWRILKDLNEMV